MLLTVSDQPSPSANVPALTYLKKLEKIPCPTLKVLVVGCGKVGSEIVRDLSRSDEVDSVVAIDAFRESLARVRAWPKVRAVKADLRQRKTLVSLMTSADVICGALPGRIGFDLLREAAERGCDIVDISYTPQDPFALHRHALAHSCVLIPQCGVAPGFTNMCVGDASTRLDRITVVRIMVGGLPQKPVPPMNYRVVFSLEDVINVYTRPVRVIEKGRQRTVEPLSGRGFLDFPGVGRLEYFLTDGLGTLSRSFSRVGNMHEFTMRYPGHVEIMDILRTLGFFDQRSVRIGGTWVEPRRLSMELLKTAFSAGTPEDLLAFRVDVEGVSGRKRVLVRYQFLDRFDRKNKVSAMARTTAYPCTSTALLLGSGKIPWNGIVTPEKIAQKPELFGFVLSRLRAEGIEPTIQTRTLVS